VNNDGRRLRAGGQSHRLIGMHAFSQVYCRYTTYRYCARNRLQRDNI